MFREIGLFLSVQPGTPMNSPAKFRRHWFGERYRAEMPRRFLPYSFLHMGSTSVKHLWNLTRDW